MEKTVANIVTNPIEFGFEWIDWTEPSKGGMVLRKVAPIARVTDVAKFESAFPGHVLGWLDGQSTRVSCQRIVRDILWDKRDTPADDLKVAQAQYFLGVAAKRRSVVTVERKVFIALDGEEYDSLEEATEASTQFLSK